MFSGMDVTTRSVPQTGRDSKQQFVFYIVNGVTVIIVIKDGTNSESR